MAAKKQQDEIKEELDNWEEIDETDVLEHRFNKLIMPSFQKDSMNGNLETTVAKLPTVVDDRLHPCIPPVEPTVKILKRPVKELKATNSDNKKLVPKKTLEQREQEYAKARLRILGEASSEKPEEQLNIIKPRLVEQSSNIIRMPKNPDGTTGFKFRR